MTFKLNKSTKVLLAFCLIGALAACTTTQNKPQVDSEEYQQALSDFYISLAAIKSDEALFAINKMQQLSETFPEEPAVWANLGVFAMRQGNFELATEHIDRAIEQAGEHADLFFLAGIVESRKGNIPEAIDYLQKASKTNPSNQRVLYTLAEELERENAEANVQEVRSLLDQILHEDPDNLAVLLEMVRISAKWGTQSELRESLFKLEEQREQWPEAVQQEFQDQKQSILEKKGNNITYEIALLRNTLQQLPTFQKDFEQVQLEENQVGFLITEFLWLPNTKLIASPPDHRMNFTRRTKNSNPGLVQQYKAIGLADEQPPSTIKVLENKATINEEIVLPFPGEDESTGFSTNAIATLDYNYDFLNDIAFAGNTGFLLYRQQQDSSFKDITSTLGLPRSITTGEYYGVWTIDHELDGDLDLLLGLLEGTPILLQNNGDGTFKELAVFPDTENLRQVISADFNLDGDSDVVLLSEEGSVHFYENKRGGTFQRDSSFSFNQQVYALNFADLNKDGKFEVLGWQFDNLTSIDYNESAASWNRRRLLTFEKREQPPNSEAQIHIADLDNNGSEDILLSQRGSSRYWLSNEVLKFDTPAVELPHRTSDLADINDDARLDLLGFQGDSSNLFINTGEIDYHAKIIRPRASGVVGDRRINSFGIGGEIETRSGVQYGKQPITQPWVHIGLGTYEEAEMVRVIWPNGTSQTEFAELGYDSKIMNEQILKGSCPWIYAFNGNKMEFVTDFLWKTSLGLKINDQGEASVLHSIDWIKVSGDQLKPREGYYDIRITADLWESHFFDHVSLMAVDHPKYTDVFVDERFALPAPDPKIYPVRNLQPVVSAVDFKGNDITEKINQKDGVYSSVPPLTSYQGLAEEHFIEVEVPLHTTPADQRWLIASGWIYPTDTSINIAINQGEHTLPKPLKVKVPDGNGGWKVAQENIGFPSGKDKTILIDLEGIFEPNTKRKIRLYTNMEIYWDQFQVGVKNYDAEIETTEIQAEIAKLQFRGFSELVNKDRFKPTKGNYQIIAGTEQRWFNLEGYYTRYGDVTELTEVTDDRYVIMNAGDELQFAFPELEPPKEGWVRDFVLIGDGWVKDGDYNTGYSKTLHPLPYHGLKDYTQKEGLLQDDPVYQNNKKDWAKFHTRFVEAKRFNLAFQ